MQTKNKLLKMSLAAIGIVYGDIGTSPLYALRESLDGLPIDNTNILGILSLIFWSLIIIISIKYLTFVLRADNNGEGGVLALLCFFKGKDPSAYKMFFIFGLFGTGLLLGDGMLTPAISVTSAVEGLHVIAPSVSHWTLPIAITILLVLFFSQRHGTAKIGGLFGPILLIWFITIGILGIMHIIKYPYVLSAVNPSYAIQFFYNNGFKGYLLLGGVFLAITGGEALYADLGHFGKKPIRLAWFSIILPCLLLNYFGQGANLLTNPQAIKNPFYTMAPDWFNFPLLILATTATVIAAQAIITATFSLIKQAILLDLYPKANIIQTSREEKGQVYVPQVNFILAVGTILLILIFKDSSGLAHAYGIAVNLDMLIVSILLFRVAQKHWQWSVVKLAVFFTLILCIETAFLGANLHKIMTGGWLPVFFALFCSLVMLTWSQGIDRLRQFYYKERADISAAITQIEVGKKMYYLSSAQWIFIADPYDKSGGSLLHFLKVYHLMPEQTLIVTIEVESEPYIRIENRFELIELDEHLHKLVIHNGFSQPSDIPLLLQVAKDKKIFPYDLDLSKAIYFIEATNIIPMPGKSKIKFSWQEKLFSHMMRNSCWDIEFFHLPHHRTITVGGYAEI